MKYSLVGLRPRFDGHWLTILLGIVLLASISSLSHGQAIDPEPCHVEKSQGVNFTGSDVGDVITVKVSGNPCSQAIVSIVLYSPEGDEIYRYEGNFIEHMPYIIYEPELNSLVEFFVSKVIDGAIMRETRDLPPYTGVDSFYEATNDFVVIDIDEYEKLRLGALPLLWHATGESTWVHVVYNPSTQLSQVIMRGGVFQ